MSLIAIHRDPFGSKPNVFELPEGSSLADMVERVTSLPDAWPRHEHDVICINGEVVPRHLWRTVKPKSQFNGVPIEVTFHEPPLGGGDGGKVLGLVASVALVAVTGGIASGAILGGFTGASAAGGATLGSLSLAAGVSAVGSLAIAALTPPPTLDNGADTARDLDNASLAGNTVQPNTPLPRALGTFRFFPPYVTAPIVYYDGEDECVEAIAALSGPHRLEDIRMGEADANDIQGVSVETREGWDTDSNLTLVTRYGRTENYGTEIRRHVLDDENQFKLDSPTGDVTDALPQPAVYANLGAPKDMQLDLSFPQGLFFNGDEVFVMTVPLRIRLRRRGTTSWVKLPEIHYSNGVIGEKRFSIVFEFRGSQSGRATVQESKGPSRAFVQTIGQSDGATTGPATQGWAANSYFVDNTGTGDYVDIDNSGTSRVANLILEKNRVRVRLHEATFPRGEYEIEVTRGYTFREPLFDPDDYSLNATVRDFFFYYDFGGPRIQQPRDKLSDSLYVQRLTSFWDEYPINGNGVALIAIKAKNVQLQRVSVLASGYVRDWNGSAWADWKVTDNPAPHLYDAFAGPAAAVPVPTQVIDNEGLVEFRSHCAAQGYRINAVVQDTSQADAAQLCASAGFGRTYQSDKWGVIWDYDRSAEGVVQSFSDRNVADFSWSKGFPSIPDGFRITYRDETREYRERQTVYPVGAVLTEQVSYTGPVTLSEVERRAEYDRRVLKGRTVFYSWISPPLAIRCRRGALVGMNVDFLQKHQVSARVVSWEIDANEKLTAVHVDQPINLVDGVEYGAIIARGNGIQTSVRLTSADGRRVVFETPINQSDIAADDFVLIGERGSEMRRFIVTKMEPVDRHNWQIEAVAEAPELWA